MQKVITTAAIMVPLLSASASAEQINVYNWSDYFGETTLADFEAASGTAVVYDRFDSLETMETRMLAGATGYDWVMTPADQGARLIAAGAIQKLDQSQLSNLDNLDPRMVDLLRTYDPELEYMLPYAWGTSGIAFNRAALLERMPDAPLDSYDLIFDPEVVSRFADCGVAIIDAPTEVVGIALNYLGLDPSSMSEENLDQAADLLSAVRPHITHLNTGLIVNNLASGEICLALTWNADAASATAQAEEAGLDLTIEYVVPTEGTVIWFDTMALPAGAPNPEGSHQFMDFLLTPEAAAGLTSYTFYANAVPASQALIEPEVLADPAVFPPTETFDNLFLPAVVTDPAAERRRTDLWSAFRTGQ